MSSYAPDVTNWKAAESFSAFAIEVRECAWCGEGFCYLRVGVHKPRITCSENCRIDNAKYVRASVERRRLARVAGNQ